MKFFRLIYLLSFFFYPVLFTGCEKEIGDIVPSEISNPYEGKYTFTVNGEYTGTANIIVNNRGAFSFFINLRDGGGGAAYTVTVTGTVNLTGQLEGSIFRTQADYGYLNGQLGGGDFVLREETGIVNCTFGTTRNQ